MPLSHLPTSWPSLSQLLKSFRSFFGSSLSVFKGQGFFLPIAVGFTLRRLVAKCLCRKVQKEMTVLPSPLQLGFGTSGGMEAVIHATRLFIAESSPTSCLLKMDFKNAFNTLSRDRMLESVKATVPILFPFVHYSYGALSFLFYNGSTILSQEKGVHQGDPLSPLLFCLTIHSIVSRLSSELKFFHLDDGTIGGSLDSILADFDLIESEAHSLGLVLNCQKSEFICPDPGVCGLAACHFIRQLRSVNSGAFTGP